jgi:AcrR family transcriptional regulator
MSAADSLLAPTRRSQAERRDESKRLLVEATLAIVAQRGVSAATFEEIGRRAGYSRGLATQKFGSKRGLIDAVIAHLHAAREVILEAEHVAEMGGLDAVLHYADGHLRGLTHEHGGRAYFMLMAAAAADATSLREAFAASHDRVRDWLAGRIRQGQAEGDIRPDIDPDAGGLMVGALLLGVSTQWLIDPAMPVERVRAASIDALRRSFQPDRVAS